MRTAEQSSYANSIYQMETVPVLRQQRHYLADFGNSPVTDLKMRLAMNTPNSLVKRVVNAAQAYKQLDTLSKKAMRKFLLRKAWRKKMMRKIRAYLRSQRRRSDQGYDVDPSLATIPTHINSELKHISHELKEMQSALRKCLNQMRLITKEKLVLKQQMQAAELTYHNQLNHLAMDTAEHLANALSDCGYEIHKQHHHFLNPMAPVAKEFAHIDLDKLVLAQQAQHGDAIHHGHVIRHVNLLAALARHPEHCQQLGINADKLCDLTHEELHCHMNCLRQHSLFSVAEKQWAKHDAQCCHLNEQQAQKVQQVQAKIASLQSQHDLLEQQVEMFCQKIDSAQQRYEALSSNIPQFSPSVVTIKKKDALLAQCSLVRPTVDVDEDRSLKITPSSY